MPCTLSNIQVTGDYGFGVAEQTNQCDFVTPTNAIAPKSLDMPVSKDFIDASGARGDHEILDSDYLEGQITYEGEATFPAVPRFIPAFLIGAYGDKSTNSTGTNFTKFAHKNDPTRLSLEGDFGTDAIQWTGCTVNELEFASSPGADLEVTASFMALAQTVKSSPDFTGAPIKTQRAFQHANATVTLFGTALPVSDITITIARPNVETFHGTSREPDNLIVEHPTEVTGSFSLPWSDEASTLFSNFKDFTMGKIIAHYIRGTNELRFTIDKAIIEDGPPADLSGMSVSDFTMDFRALAPSNQDSALIEITSTT